MPDDVVRRLDRVAAERQAESRVPGLLVGLVRGREPVWSNAVGVADVDAGVPPTADTQFAVGSITKTFTAALVMALRDEGRLDLDDRLGEHLPDTRHQHVTLRRMLAHASGLQREPLGDIWDTFQMPDADALLEDFEAAEQVLPPSTRWHYSNLAYAVLGQVVARIDGRTWADSLRARVLVPLGLERTTLLPEGEVATGYFTDPFSDAVHVQPVSDLSALAPAGALWSTLTDLTTWAGFLAAGDDRLLPDARIEEMAQVQVMADPLRWGLAWGLGLELFRSGERIYAGHTGGMPGFLSAVVAHRDSGTAAIVLANAMSGFDPGDTAVSLLDLLLDEDAAPVPAWRAGAAVPADLADLVGRWWVEGSPTELSVHGGALQARMEEAPRHAPPAVFERLDADTFRTVSGRERGELLRVTRDAAGAVTVLHWATYRMSRQPESFGEQRGG